MKRFLKRCALLTGIFFGLHLVLVSLTVIALQRISLELPEEKHTLYIGQSHIECAVDDSIVPDAVNMALSAEVGIVQVEKLKAYLAANPHIDTVVMPLFGHYEATSGSRCSYLEYYLGFGYMEQLIKFSACEDWNCLVRMPITYKLLLRMPYQDIGLIAKFLTGKQLSLADFHFGGFNKLERSGLEADIEKSLQREPIHSFFVQDHLREAQAICRERGVKLILMQTPIYSQHRFFDVDGFERFKRDSLEEFAIADYSDFELPADAFADITHLNYKGAGLFSSHLAAYGLKVDDR